MQQLELFDYRRDSLFESENRIAHYFDILKETEDDIIYAEHINPKKGFAVAGMEYEEYIDVKKNGLKGGVIILAKLIVSSPVSFPPPWRGAGPASSKPASSPCKRQGIFCGPNGRFEKHAGNPPGCGSSHPCSCPCVLLVCACFLVADLFDRSSVCLS